MSRERRGKANCSSTVLSVQSVDVRQQIGAHLPIIGWGKQIGLPLPRRLKPVQYHPRLFVHGAGAPQPLERGAGMAQQVARIVGGAGQGNDCREGVGRGLGAVAVLADEYAQGIGGEDLPSQFHRSMSCLLLGILIY